MLEITEATINDKKFFILNAYIYTPVMPDDAATLKLEDAKKRIMNSNFVKMAEANGAVVSTFVWRVRPEMLNSKLKPEWADEINKTIDERLEELAV